MKNILSTLANWSLPLAACAVIGACSVAQGIHERAHREAAHIADRLGDNNKLISSNEYSTIYQTLGLKDTGRNAYDLSTDQLKRYVALQKIKMTSDGAQR